jgi:hypothetical protein
MRETLRVRFWHTSEMARFGGLGFWCGFIASGARLVVCLVGFLAVWSGSVLAAQVVQLPRDGEIPTLHVYTNLIQIPVLVLGPGLERLKDPIAESRFSVSIGGGPWFQATHVRPEGDDPISLSILLDLSGPEDAMSSKLASAIADLAPRSLRPRDRISIYVLDCSLKRSLDNAPAEYDSLKHGVHALLRSRTAPGQGEKAEPCTQPVGLWDALGQISKNLYQLPGRRVILAVTDGQDKGSGRTWNELRTFTQATGVTIFGLSYMQSAYPRPLQSYEYVFNDLCELSGGMVLRTDEVFVSRTLRRFTKILRERYIVEFPRPAHATAGEESMQVKIDKSGNDFVRAAGKGVPLPDAAVLADPTTVPSDPSLTPEVGNGKIVTKPQ